MKVKICLGVSCYFPFSHTPSLRDSRWDSVRDSPQWHCLYQGRDVWWIGQLVLPWPGTSEWFFYLCSSFFSTTEELHDPSPRWIICQKDSIWRYQGPSKSPMLPFPPSSIEFLQETAYGWCRPQDAGHLLVPVVAQPQNLWCISLQYKGFVKVWTLQHQTLTQGLLDMVMKSSHCLLHPLDLGWTSESSPWVKQPLQSSEV